MKKEDGSINQSQPKYYRHEYAIPFDESIVSKSNLEIIQYLKERTILFKDISDNLIDQLVPLSAIEKYEADEKILVEDTPNNKIFFLMRGIIGIYKQGEHILKLQRKGDIFGEMSLISDKNTSATVLAESRVDVFSINVKGIESYTSIDENTVRDTLYKLYAVILADKLAMTTFKAIGLERKVKERTLDLKTNNEKLIAAKEEAEKANKAKSRFLSNITHELRTPMHHIISYAQIGIKFFNSYKENALDCFHSIISSSNTMMRFIDDLLDLSEMDAGRMKYSFVENDMYVLLHEKLTGFSHALEKRKIHVKMTKPDFSTSVACDSSKIGQLIDNLLLNSIELTPEGKEIRIEFDLQKADNKEMLCIAIIDQGPGIPADELDQIFEKFVQSSLSTSASGGSGIGLAICQEIVRAHNGQIWAENNPDGGAAFRFLLPLRQTRELQTAPAED